MIRKNVQNGDLHIIGGVIYIYTHTEESMSPSLADNL